MRPIAIDLFAGAGGMSLGFEQAGFDVVAAVEIDPVHCAVHKYNFPHCAIVPRSVVGLSAADIRKAAGIGDRKVSVVFGGPPCQGFSLIGHRALDDARNRLVLEFVRLVSELDAEAFVFENVKGLTVGNHRSFLRELIEAFEHVGYDVRTPTEVLNAASYRVPQSRERLILLGAKRGLMLPSYPQARTRLAQDKIADKRLPLAPTCREALSDIPNADEFSDLMDDDEVFSVKWGRPSLYAAELRGIGDSAWHFGYKRSWNPKVLTSSTRTDHTSISRRRFDETHQGAVEPISRFFRLPADGVSNTLRAGTDAARGAFTSPRPIHYLHPRCITVREMARLHGFPDWFRFHVTKWHGARQIGNAVPPPMARAVAAEVISSLGYSAEAASEVVSPGDPNLLKMDMAAASAHFGIPAPIGRRDRKSGARKRKQSETEAERLLLLARAANA